MMITPLQFARALQQSLAYRTAGMSQIEAVTQACRTVGISPEWALIVQLTLEASSALAESWCERQINSALDHAHENDGAFK